MLKTSLLITGDSSVAQKQVDELAASVKALGTGAKATAAPVAELDQAQRGAADSAREVAAATVGAGKAQIEAAGAGRAIAAAQEEASAAQIAAAASARDLAQALSAAEAAQLAAVAGAREGAAAQAMANAAMERLAAEAGQLGSILGTLAAASRQASAGTEQVTTSEREATAGSREYAAQLARLRAELDPAGEAQRRLAQATDLLDTALARGDITADEYALGLKRATAAANGLSEGHARMGASGMIAEHVVRAFSDSVAAGQSPIRAATMEMGRVTEAMTLWAAQSGATEGTVGRLAAFMGGPWGLAISVGIAVLTPLIGKLFETSDAADAAKDALTSFAKFEDDVGNFIDKTTGKLIAQNAELAKNAKLLAAKKGDDAAKLSLDKGREAFAAVQAYGTVGRTSFREGATGRAGNADIDAAIVNANGNVNKLADSIDALAAKNQAFKPLADSVRSLAGQATFANRTLHEQRGIVNELSVALGGGTVATSATIRAQVDAESATTRVEKARANLNAVTKEGEAIDRMAYGPARIAALEAYHKKLLTATNEVSDAQEAAKKRPKPRSTAARDEFGLGADQKIDNLLGQFGGEPSLVVRTNKEVGELDRLIEQLGRRRPPDFRELIDKAEAAKVTIRDGLIVQVAKAFDQPKTLAERAGVAIASLDAEIAALNKEKPTGFEKLIADAGTAKAVIADALQKPYRDYINDQRDGLAVQSLVTAGRVDEANALKEIQRLEKGNVPLTDQQKDGVLATVQAIRAEQRELEIRNELNEKYLTAIGSIRNAVDDATQAFVRGDLGQFIKTPGKLLDAFKTLQGQQLFDKLFSGVFRDLQDQIAGTSPVKDAARRMGAAVDDVAARSKDAAAAFASFKPPTDAATSALGSFTAALTAATTAVKLDSAPDPEVSTGGNSSSSNVDPATGDIVVTGQRPPAPDLAIPGTVGSINLPVDPRIAAALNAKPSQISTEQLFSNAIGKLATSLVGVFTNPQAASLIGRNIGKYAGQGLEGAATGTAVAGVAKAVGIKLNSTGSQVGGAVGQVAFGPIGGLVGSIAGGIIGNLFGSVKYGGATITSKGVQGTVGNSDAGKSAGTVAGKSILSALGDIAAQLGGTATGDFGTITVGAYKDKFRVNDHGTNLKSNNDVLQYDTMEEAQAFALSAAVARNAIQGITEPVRKALLSNFNDTASALKEALKVGDLQTLIGGTQASLAKIFATEEANAKERLRLAQTYGVDIIATEKANADSMSKLVASTLKSQVGSLQSLIDDMTSGSLFEGNALDKIASLNTAIAKAKTDLDAGVDGAADTLAKLYQDRLTASKDAYGTTGAYAADRTATLDDARSAITRANAQIVAAQSKSDPALATTNAALDENNDQNAQLLAAQNATNGLLTSIAGSFKMNGFDLSSMAAY